jgi:exosortase K
MRARVAIALVVLSLAGALALKQHYSTASADELRWILGPTAALVELSTGVDFVAERGAGHLSTEHHFLIAPSCAGVNFLIVAFAALVLGLVRTRRRIADNALLVAGSAAAAYAAALVANTLRIALALALHDGAVSWGWLDGERLHVIAGVVVYLVILLALFAGARRLARERIGAWLPVMVYLVVALLVPLANGGYARAAFWQHAAIVAGVLAAIMLAAAALRRARAAQDRGAEGGAEGGAQPLATGASATTL